MIAWKLTTNFDQQKHLFFDKIETNYIIETYICSCGCTDFIILYPRQKIDYMCQECGNTKFYDANSAWRNIAHFLYQNLDLEFSYEYDIQSDNNSITSLYVTRIPRDINFSNHKVIFSKKTIYSLILSINGELKENYSLSFNPKILTQLEKNLIHYIKQNSCFNIPNSGTKNLILPAVVFFLKNKHLKEFDFYYWNDISTLDKENIHISDALALISNYPKTKSVKRAVYKNYSRQLDDTGRFDSTFIEVFCKNIEDKDILTQLLHLPLKSSVYSRNHKETIYNIIVLLKRYYSEKELLKFFSATIFNSNYYVFNSNYDLFHDLIKEFYYHKNAIENNFRKVPFNLQTIHDEFLRCSNEESSRDKNLTLIYSQEKIELCVEINNYHVLLPKNRNDLINWSKKLKNSIYEYFEMIKYHETLIYGFFQENILVFIVEILDNKILHASGKYNKKLTPKQNQVLTKWFQLFFQKNQQGATNVT